MIKRIIPAVIYVTAALILQFMPLSYAQAGICTLSNASVVNVVINEQIRLTPSTSVPAMTSTLYSGSFATGSISYSCTGSSTQWESAYSRAYTATSIDNIYNTEIQGIGIRIKWPESYSDSYYIPGTGNECTSGCVIHADNVLLEFLHIGIVSAGEKVIPAGEIASAYFLNDNGTPKFMTVTLGANVIISPKTCAIYPSSNHIDLGNYTKADLENGEADVVDFYITLRCPEASTVDLTFESTSNIFSSGSGDIGASASSVPGLSVKVNIQLQYGIRPLPIILETQTYTYRNILAFNVPMQAQIFVKDPALFASSGGPGTVSSNLLYTMSIR